MSDDLWERLAVAEQSRDRWRDRAKRAQNELSDLRAAIGLSGIWTTDDSVGVYRYRADAAEARLADLVAAVEALADEWGHPADCRCGDDLDRLRAILAEHGRQA